MIGTASGCPLPVLASEVERARSPVKASLEAVIRGLAARLPGPVDEGLSEDRAPAIVALCVGYLGVAQAVEDEALRDCILAACRDLARAGPVSDTPTPANPPRERKGR